ncbi:MAG TPA: 5'/3'-nucleotidase SurE [Casimicrobiaceae bacterium]
MRILVGNDDGITAPGLSQLVGAAAALDGERWVVAPDRKWTAASHQLSFDRELVLSRVGERAYACSGAPADCIVAAMTVLFADGGKPDLVLAGINDGRNVAEDIAYSGTLAIGREATFWGVPAICISRVKSATPGSGDDAAVGALLRILWDTRVHWAGDGHWLAVNLPAKLPASIVTASIGRDKIATGSEVVERTPERIRYRLRRGRAHTSVRGDENAAIDAGKIVIVRHGWAESAALGRDLIDSWNRSLR